MFVRIGTVVAYGRISGCIPLAHVSRVRRDRIVICNSYIYSYRDIYNVLPCIKGRHLADELVPKVPIVVREFIFSIFLSNVKIKISVITQSYNCIYILPIPILAYAVSHRIFKDVLEI